MEAKRVSSLGVGSDALLVPSSRLESQLAEITAIDDSIVGAEYAWTSDIRDRAQEDQHTHTMKPLKNEQAEASGGRCSWYTPIPRALSEIPHEDTEQLCHKFEKNILLQLSKKSYVMKMCKNVTCTEKSYKCVKISQSLPQRTVCPTTFKKWPIKTDCGYDKWPSKIETLVCTPRSRSW